MATGALVGLDPLGLPLGLPAGPVPGLPLGAPIPGLPFLGLPGWPPLDSLNGMLAGLMAQVAADATRLFAEVMDRFFLRTESFDPGGGPFTHNHALTGMYGVTAGIARAAIAVAILYVCLRAMFEHGYHPRYSVKLLLPRLMLVVALVQLGLSVVQGAVDLNNALVERIWFAPIAGADRGTAWATFLRGDFHGNLILGLLITIAAILLVVIAVTAVARNVLLVFLAAAMPLVMLGVLVPELHALVYAWRRLFFTTVFSQVAEVMMLRLAFLLTFDRGSGFIDAVHGLVAFYLVLKMPSALHAASHAESKVMTLARHAEHAMVHALTHAPAAAHASHTRAHPAAS